MSTDFHWVMSSAFNKKIMNEEDCFACLPTMKLQNGQTQQTLLTKRGQ
jgi:hypothetical protein